jgi:bifunctional UDP-N-acetylglucosamine pyrophosphorylase/glucosamine-1-phosphate N-acetyltransferase
LPLGASGAELNQEKDRPPSMSDTPTPSRPRAFVIMAAGLGTRMRSGTIKVLHTVAGRPLVDYPVRVALALGAARVVVVLGHQKDRVEAHLRTAFEGAPLAYAEQPRPLGTAHAVLCALPALEGFEGDVVVLSGDVPNLPQEALAALIALPGAVRVLGMRLNEPAQYGRFVRSSGRLVRIREFKDCSPEERTLDEVNAGIYAIDAAFLRATLHRLGTDNAQGEYYLTDLVEHAAEAGQTVETLTLEGDAALDLNGVNDRVELAAAEARMQARLRAQWMRSGVTFVAPERTWLHADVALGEDTVVEPDVSLLGSTRVGRDCVLEQGVRLVDAVVGDGAVVHAYSVVERAQIGEACSVGPMARLREGTVLGRGVKIGNFVETKKAVFGDGAKASHLSYLGDAHIGAKANIGAGTITCNYDGVNKFETHVGAGAFIGSDSQLVAPVRVGDGAYVGAGTTVTHDVPPGALALTRAPYKVVEGWAERKRLSREAATASKAPGHPGKGT